MGRPADDIPKVRMCSAAGPRFFPARQSLAAGLPMTFVGRAVAAVAFCQQAAEKRFSRPEDHSDVFGSMK
jgi:hypothetical protein